MLAEVNEPVFGSGEERHGGTVDNRVKEVVGV